MVNLGRFEVEVDPDDKWTVTTVDGSLSAQFEHTVVVTKTGVEVLTKRPKPLRSARTSRRFSRRALTFA